jgi:hypothetical protein
LLSGSNNTHIATLVERHSRFTMLVKLEGKDTARVVTALSKQVRKLPSELRRSLTWDRGMEMAEQRFTIATDVNVTSAIRKALAAWYNENKSPAAPVFSERHQSLWILPVGPEQDRATIESAPTQDLGISDAGR